MTMKCDRDCFNCPYPDCIEDELTGEELLAVQKVDRELDAEIIKRRYKGYQQKYYQTHREERLAYSRQYYQAHRDTIREYDKTRYAANAEAAKARQREYYRQNRDRITARRREQYAARKRDIDHTRTMRERRQTSGGDSVQRQS